MDINDYPVLRTRIRELKKGGTPFMSHVRMGMFMVLFSTGILILITLLALPYEKFGIGYRLLCALMVIYGFSNIRSMFRSRRAAAESRCLLKKNLRMTDYEAQFSESMHNNLFMRSALIARTTYGLIYLPYENITNVYRDDAYLNTYAAVIVFDRDENQYEVYMEKRSPQILKERDAVYRRLKENCERRGISPEGSYVNFRGTLPSFLRKK